jgi:uncharacterized membrane protein YfcA
MFFDWPVSLCGFVVGSLVGLTGMGGGSAMTALLILLFGIHPVTAVGTDLLYAGITKLTGAIVHHSKGNVDWRIVVKMSSGSVPGSILAILLLSNIDRHDATLSRAISLTIGLGLILAAVGLLLRRRFEKYARAHSSVTTPSLSKSVMTVCLGAILGGLVALTSIGAGAIGLAILVCLYPHASAVRLVGTDIAHAVPLTLLAGGGHWLIGSVHWPLLLSLLLGSMPGIVIASHLAHKVPERVLLPALALLLVVLGGRLAIGNLPGSG